MKLRPSVLSRVRWCLMLATTLFLPVAAFAQDEEVPKALPFALAGGFLLFFLLVALAVYIYIALALQTIANKTNTDNAWLAWIPIAQIVLMLNIARKPIWWIILFFIPLVGIVMAIIVWMGIAEARNKPNWWGILMIVPIVGIIVPGYLAWSD